MAGAILLSTDIVTGRETLPNAEWYIAREMQDLGLRPGDRIAYVGLPVAAYWARLAGVRIVAEVPFSFEPKRNLSHEQRIASSEVDAFWHADQAQQRCVLDAFARAGSAYVVADMVPSWAGTAGWHKLRAAKEVGNGPMPVPLPVYVLRLWEPMRSNLPGCDESAIR
jgi:hypothetical protein